MEVEGALNISVYQTDTSLLNIPPARANVPPPPPPLSPAIKFVSLSRYSSARFSSVSLLGFFFNGQNFIKAPIRMHRFRSERLIENEAFRSDEFLSSSRRVTLFRKALCVCVCVCAATFFFILGIWHNVDIYSSDGSPVQSKFCPC